MTSFLRLLCACLLPLVLLVLLAGCGGGGEAAAPQEPPPSDPPQDAVCAPAKQRESLLAYMQDHYFFTARAGDPGASTQDAYFRSLLAPADRWSYAESTVEHDLLLILGRRIGYGYTLAWADAAQTALKVRNVEPRSPLARAGVVRGDTIVSIDGNPPARVAAGFPGTVSAAGIPREFRLRSLAGVERTVTVVSEQFELSAVPATATFNVTRGEETIKAGYVAYQQFATYGFIDIGDAIRSLSAAGVKELVLDLRYNGGGSVNVSRDLASMVGGDLTKGQIYSHLRYNSRHRDSDLTLRFATIPGALPAPPLQGLQRVVVIASASTASASELVINGLKPFMPVVLIGETTFGKPYGFTPRDSCGTTYNAVNFETFNANSVGGFTSGFAPDCAVADDLDRQLGDPQERRIRAALYYIANGRCEAAAPQGLGAQAARQPAIGETVPSRMVLD